MAAEAQHSSAFRLVRGRGSVAVLGGPWDAGGFLTFAVRGARLVIILLFGLSLILLVVLLCGSGLARTGAVRAPWAAGGLGRGVAAFVRAGGALLKHWNGWYILSTCSWVVITDTINNNNLATISAQPSHKWHRTLVVCTALLAALVFLWILRSNLRSHFPWPFPSLWQSASTCWRSPKPRVLDFENDPGDGDRGST